MSHEALSPVGERMTEDRSIRSIRVQRDTKRDYIGQARDFTGLPRSMAGSDEGSAALPAPPGFAGRLMVLDERRVTFPWKEYRVRGKGVPWQKALTLPGHKLIRRFQFHVLPDGFHCIRHCGLFASRSRAANITGIHA